MSVKLDNNGRPVSWRNLGPFGGADWQLPYPADQAAPEKLEEADAAAKAPANPVDVADT